MKTFEFEIKELLSRLVEVKATTENEAYLKVKRMYHKEEIILDSSDCIDTEIEKVKQG